MSFFTDHSRKKITILLGHPDKETLSGDFAGTYEAAAKSAGHEVRRFNIGDMAFDPILHKGYKEIQALEPDLIKLQEAISWCDHFVVVYPNWWSTMPAILKGLFDRMWLPGFCFRYHKKADGTRALTWDKLMKGKTARVFVLSGAHPWLILLGVGDYTNEIKRGILGFAGFKVSMTRMGPVEHAPEWKIKDWRKIVLRLGKDAE